MEALFSSASLRSVLNRDWQFCRSSEVPGPSTRAHLSSSPQIEGLIQGLLTFGPCAWLLVGILVKAKQLRAAKSAVLPLHNNGLAKVAIALLLFAIHSSAFRSQSHPELQNRMGPLILSFASPATTLVLSLLEQCHSVSSSNLMVGHLVFAIFSEIIQAGLIYVGQPSCSTVSFLLASITARLVLLMLETLGSTRSHYHTRGRSSPEDTSGFLSVLSFWWVNDCLRLGYRKTLSLEDVPPLPRLLDAAKMREALQLQWEKRETPEGRFSLMWAQLQSLWRLNLLVVTPYALLVLLRCAQPFVIRRAIAFFNQDLPAFEARSEALRLLLMTFSLYSGIAVLNGVTKRLLGQLNCAIRMSLVGVLYSQCLRSIDHVAATDSAIVTLASNDTESAANLANVVHETWSQVLELAVGTYLLADEMGWVCLVPPLVALIISQTVKAVTEDLGSWHVAYSAATQSRITATKVVLDAIKNVKIMGVSENMEQRIRLARAREMKQYTLLYRLLVAFFVSGVALHLFSPAITLATYAIQSHFRGAAVLDVNKAFTSIAIISIVTSPANTLLTVLPEAMSVISAFQRIQEYLLKPSWQDRRVLIREQEDDIDSSSQGIEIIDSKLSKTAVRIDNATIIPAGALNPVLRDIETVWNKGDLIVVAGPVGSGKTILAKMLLGDLSPDTGAIYTAYRSIAYCSQTAWLTNTTIQEAIQGPSPPMKGAEDKWYHRVLHACALEKDLKSLPRGDQTIIGSRGASLSGGQKQRVALARAVYSRKSLAVLDDVLGGVDSVTEKHIIDNILGPGGLFKEVGTTVVMITHSVNYLPLADHVVVLDKTGTIAEQGLWKDLQATAKSIPELNMRSQVNTLGISSSSDDPDDAHPKESLESVLQRDQTTPSSVGPYAYYIKAIGLRSFLLLIGSLFFYAAFAAAVPFCLQWLTESKGQRIWLPMGAYLFLTIATFASVSLAVAVVFLVIAPQAGNVIHAQLLHTVMYAPLSYFTGTATGATLNYFNGDIATIDRSLPFSLFQTCQAAFRLLAQAVLLGTLQPSITITMPFTILAIYLAQKFYLATSRQLQALSIQAQASVQESFLETLEGVATIRAFGWQDHFLQSTTAKLDVSWRPEYMLSSTQRWLDFVLDLLVMGLALSVIGLGVVLRGTATGSQVGIALNVVLQLNNYILRLVEAWAKFEASAAVVSRLRSFEQQVQSEENSDLKDIPPAAWPADGAIHVSHVSASYSSSIRALDDISFSVNPGTKVGIVGRTGSGKSSLLLTLLRLVDIQSTGTVSIDNINLMDVPRNLTRSRIITIPQDPMLFSEDSLRHNLNLSGLDIPEDELIKVLERVNLWEMFKERVSNAPASSANVNTDGEDNTPESEGQLSNYEPDEPGITAGDQSNSAEAHIFSVPMKLLPLSQGQHQLFSLARALLMRANRGRVVLLDEATSNVDLATERLMQQVIKEDFKGHTIITIAHRLDTIMSSDVVLVLDSGRLIEAGRPSVLGEKHGGAFRELVLGGKPS